MLKWITFLLLWSACAECTKPAKTSNQADKVQGTLSEEYYIDPTSTFRVKRLKGAVNLTIKEIFDSKGLVVGVTFHDAMGQLVRYERLIDSKKGAKDLLSDDEALNWAFEFTFDTIRNQLPGTKIMEKQKLEIEPFGTIYVGIFFIPQGSSVIDARTMINHNARRAFAFRFDGDDLIIASVQEFDFLRFCREQSGAEPTEKENMMLMNKTLDAIKSYQRLK